MIDLRWNGRRILNLNFFDNFESKLKGSSMKWEKIFYSKSYLTILIKFERIFKQLYRNKATFVYLKSQISILFLTHRSPSCNGWFNLPFSFYWMSQQNIEIHDVSTQLFKMILNRNWKDFWQFWRRNLKFDFFFLKLLRFERDRLEVKTA